jgi:hypothetical protein
VRGTQRRGGRRPREAAMGNREPSRGVARALPHLDAREMGLRRRAPWIRSLAGDLGEVATVGKLAGDRDRHGGWRQIAGRPRACARRAGSQTAGEEAERGRASAVVEETWRRWRGREGPGWGGGEGHDLVEAEHQGEVREELGRRPPWPARRGARWRSARRPARWRMQSSLTATAAGGDVRARRGRFVLEGGGRAWPEMHAAPAPWPCPRMLGPRPPRGCAPPWPGRCATRRVVPGRIHAPVLEPWLRLAGRVRAGGCASEGCVGGLAVAPGPELSRPRWGHGRRTRAPGAPLRLGEREGRKGGGHRDGVGGRPRER